METRLRVKPLPPPLERQKISFRLPVPILTTFQTYLAVYKEIYGEEANPDFVVEQIFSSFFESDRAFAAYVKKGSEPKEAKPKKEKKRAVLAGENTTQGEIPQI